MKTRFQVTVKRIMLTTDGHFANWVQTDEYKDQENIHKDLLNCQRTRDFSYLYYKLAPHTKPLAYCTAYTLGRYK